LSKVITDNELKNKNVFAEMGSAWAIAMRDPIQAQHYIGKMLKSPRRRPLGLGLRVPGVPRRARLAQADLGRPRRHAYNPPVIRTRTQYMQLWRERIARGEIG
jgi:hypothetical protein